MWLLRQRASRSAASLLLLFLPHRTQTQRLEALRQEAVRRRAERLAAAVMPDEAVPQQLDKEAFQSGAAEARSLLAAPGAPGAPGAAPASTNGGVAEASALDGPGETPPTAGTDAAAGDELSSAPGEEPSEQAFVGGLPSTVSPAAAALDDAAAAAAADSHGQPLSIEAILMDTSLIQDIASGTAAGGGHITDTPAGSTAADTATAEEAESVGTITVRQASFASVSSLELSTQSGGGGFRTATTATITEIASSVVTEASAPVGSTTAAFGSSSSSGATDAGSGSGIVNAAVNSGEPQLEAAKALSAQPSQQEGQRDEPVPVKQAEEGTETGPAALAASPRDASVTGDCGGSRGGIAVADTLSADDTDPSTAGMSVMDRRLRGPIRACGAAAAALLAELPYTGAASGAASAQLQRRASAALLEKADELDTLQRVRYPPAARDEQMKEETRRASAGLLCPSFR